MERKLKQRPCNLIKIVLFGPESTGKTSLAKKLAGHYNTEWVEEYMRIYLQEKWDRHRQVAQAEDILPIAEGQIQLENQKSETARQVLFCDTDLLELKVYSEAYYDGFCDPLLLKHALNNHYHLYFLTYIDVPWTPDDLRDKPHDREGMYKRFESALQLSKKPFLVLKGDLEERFETAVSKIDELLKKNQK